MTRLVIFDLDGTLINSIYDIADATNNALAELKCPVHEVKCYYRFVGDGALDLIRRALPEKMRDNDTILKTRALFEKYYKENYLSKTKPYDGIPELLQKLRMSDIKLAVLSNKPHSFTEKIVKAFWQDTFDIIQGNIPDIPKKPDPVAVHIIMQKLDIDKNDTLFIGDSDVDILTAKGAEIKSVGCLWGYRTKEELIKTGADYIAKAPLDILNFIKRND
jgi:phosphoglycolate phosphatase